MRQFAHLSVLAALLCVTSGEAAAARPAASSSARQDLAVLRKCSATKVEQPSYVTLGKSTIVMLPYDVVRMAVGGAMPGSRAAVAQPGPNAAAPAAPAGAAATAPAMSGGQDQDGVSEVRITLLAPNELFVLGRRSGGMNVILQDADGRCHLKDIVVTVDPEALQGLLTDLVPEERGIKVRAAENSLVLTGEVSDNQALDNVIQLAASYGDGKKIVNMLRVAGAQQVLLEVKIAEVSKTLLDKLGASAGITRNRHGGNDNFSVLSDFLSNGGAFVEALRIGRTAIRFDGQKDDGLVRVLAEPTIMAISGQQASFLSGGKIFIPVARESSSVGGFGTISLEEKEFGIGVKFTPTVLGASRINLKMTSEVSDLSQTGSPFATVNGVTAVLPSFTVRRADTTVQLNDGQSLVIAGLIKNNLTETIKRFPGLGEVPILGALFRSSEFQKDETELMFVITPRLVKPLSAAPRLPTDNHIPPSRGEIYLNGSLERAAPASNGERKQQ